LRQAAAKLTDQLDLGLPRRNSPLGFPLPSGFLKRFWPVGFG
jgi:hypothetical protein